MIGVSINNNNISVIIPVLNEEKHLKRLLPYLIYHAGEHCEIIVVDGGSKDASQNLIPADFLIDENFNIVKAHYGSNLRDHIPIEDIKSFAGL